MDGTSPQGSAAPCARRPASFADAVQQPGARGIAPERPRGPAGRECCTADCTSMTRGRTMIVTRGAPMPRIASRAAPSWCGMPPERAGGAAKSGNGKARSLLSSRYAGPACAMPGKTMENKSMKPFDEMLQSGDMVRAPYARLKQWLDTQNPASLAQKARDAENVFRKTGITFAVYGDADAAERLIPFDIVPRIISGNEWNRLSLGIEQRVMALNAFLDDIYHRQEIVRAGIVPKHLIAHNDAFLPEMIDFRPPGNVYTHIIGVDIVRTGEN
ncbi:circularly permuted type 2 ATP-grasp protein, partial [Burkholderia ubonensis]|uniref:circularly permuted type 2 ATP-grasp protein n=1 Tax=Burkholderia ubonensis TaxID=101571 RepID=UPI00210B36A7